MIKDKKSSLAGGKKNNVGMNLGPVSKAHSYEKVPKGPKKKADTNGIRKAAMLMIVLGADRAASIIQALDENEIQLISQEMAKIKKISHEEKTKILEEFSEIIKQGQFIVKGGRGAAKDILKSAFGESEAERIISNLPQSLGKKPFDFLNEIDPEMIKQLIQTEHPQTIALTLSYLKSDIASKVLKELPKEVQSAVAKRIAVMERTTPDVVKTVERVLLNKLAYIESNPVPRIDGIDALAEILNNMDKETEKNILHAIEDDDINLASEIKEKMFLFEDIVDLTDREIQKALEKLRNEDIALALKGEDSPVQEKLLSNMSKNRRQEILDQIKILGRVRYREVHHAQQKILNLLKQMEIKGQLYLKNRKSVEFVV